MGAPAGKRTFDLVVFGATGFTGKLVSEYVARRYGGVIRWALAGRNRAKLEEVRASLEGAKDLPLLVADAKKRDTLDAVVREARVVLTTVGPYSLHGRELVAACVEAGTDYVDLTGEVPFIRDMIDTHHARAQETRARIVHSCGYDSIPSDIGTFVLQTRAIESCGSPTPHVHCFAAAAKGGFSGGTFASMANLIEEFTKDSRVRRVAADPYALDPGFTGPDRADQRGVRFDEESGRWTGPFLMAACNTRVVRRSNALLGYRYGREFRYEEAMSFSRGAKGLAMAAGVTAATTGLALAMASSPVRKLLTEKILPKPGEGPSREARERGYFKTRLYGTAPDGGAKPAHIVVTVTGDKDPGYGATSKMIAESAMALIEDADGVRKEGGILTPASCMGMELARRLGDSGIEFDVAVS